MLSIKINDTFLDLADDTRISYVLNNPAFDMEALQGDYSYPFNIPATSKNRITLNLNNYTETPSSSWLTKQKCEVYDDGVLIIRGLLYLDRASDLVFECHITSGLGNFADIKDTKLPALDYGGDISIRDSGSPQYQWFELLLTGTTGGSIIIAIKDLTVIIPFNTTIHQTLLDAAASITGVQIFTWDTALDYLTTATVSGAFIRITANWAGATPVFSCLAVGGGTGGTFTLSSSYPSWKVLQTEWTAYIDSAMAAAGHGTTGSKNVIFAPVRNDDSGILDKFFTDGTPLDTFWQNYYYAVTGFYTFSSLDLNDPRFQSAISPFPCAFYIVDTILLNAFKEIVYDKINATINLETIVTYLAIWNNYSCEDPDYINEGHSALSVASIISEWYNIQNHVPDITVAEFLNAIRLLTSIVFFAKPGSDVVSMSSLSGILKAEFVRDYTGKFISEPISDKPANQGFHFSFLPDGGDQLSQDLTKNIEGKTIVEVYLYTDLPAVPDMKTIYLVGIQGKYYRPQFNPYLVAYNYQEWGDDVNSAVTGDKPYTDITPQCDTLHMVEDATFGSSHHIMVPYVKQKMTSYRSHSVFSSDDEYKQPFGLRFLQYIGMAPDAASAYTYPLASSDNIYINNISFANPELALRWGDARIGEANGERKGLKNLYTDWLTFLNTAKQVEQYVNINHIDFLNIDMSEKISNENSIYLIKMVELEFPLTQPAKYTLMKYE
jgi:hypothetical protein